MLVIKLPHVIPTSHVNAIKDFFSNNDIPSFIINGENVEFSIISKELHRLGSLFNNLGAVAFKARGSHSLVVIFIKFIPAASP